MGVCASASKESTQQPPNSKNVASSPTSTDNTTNTEIITFPRPAAMTTRWEMSDTYPNALYRTGLFLTGMPGSGVSTVESTLNLPPTSSLLLGDLRFLTTPQIYSDDRTFSRSIHPNSLGVRKYTGLKHQKLHELIDHEVWATAYGGRGDLKSRFQVLTNRLARGIIFTVDARRRDRLTPPVGYEPLGIEMVMNYATRSQQEQSEILATLTSDKHLFASDMLSHLLKQLASFGQERLPLLVLLTHADCEGAMSVDEVCDALKLKELNRRRDWRISGCNALTGEGLEEAIEWLNHTIAAPTTFILESTDQYDQFDEKVWGEYNRKLHKNHEQLEQRNKILANGGVVKAPRLYKTNGELWDVTKEQRKQFVVANVTKLIEVKDKNAKINKKQLPQETSQEPHSNDNSPTPTSATSIISDTSSSIYPLLQSNSPPIPLEPLVMTITQPKWDDRFWGDYDFSSENTPVKFELHEKFMIRKHRFEKKVEGTRMDTSTSGDDQTAPALTATE